MRYPVALSKDDNGTLLVRISGLPGGATPSERTRTKRWLMPQMPWRQSSTRISRTGADIPAPSTRKRGPVVELEPLMVAKVGLYRAMRDQKIGKAELGRRLGWHLPQVDRILNVRHTSRLDQLQQALAVLGKRVTLTVTDG